MVQKWRKAGKKEKETVNILKCMREVEKKYRKERFEYPKLGCNVDYYLNLNV